MNNKMDSKLVATIKVCSISFIFACMTAALAGDVFSIWLDKNLGLSGSKIGQLFALKAMFAIFYKPIFGYLLDKFQLKKGFILTIPILGLLIGPFFNYIYAPLLMNPKTFVLGGLLGGLYFGFVIIAGGAAIFNYTDRYIRAHGGTYGIVSAFNIAGWGVMGLISSIIYNINPIYNFFLSSFLSFVLILLFLSLKTSIFLSIGNKAIAKSKITFKDIIDLFKNRNFYVLITFVVFCTGVIYLQQYQLGRYTASFWSSKTEAVKILGYLAIPFSIIGFTVSIFSSNIIKKIGVDKSLIFLMFSTIVFLIIAGSAGFMHSRPLIITARVFAVSTNPIINVAILAYVAEKFSNKVNGTAYLVGFHFINNLTLTLFGPSVGKMFDKIGFSQGYIDLGGIVFLGIIITLIFMFFSNRIENKPKLAA